jgi:hypothetical protein
VKRLLAALAVLVPVLAGCQASPDRLAGTYDLTIDATFGAITVTGAGPITLGPTCAMDITLTVTSSLASPSPTPSASSTVASPVTDPSGSFRFTRAPGGPTTVSRDGATPMDVQDPAAPTAALAALLPLAVSSYPLPAYGDHLCAFAAIDALATRAANGELAWDLDLVTATRTEAHRVYHRDIATQAGLPDDRAAEYLDWASRLDPPFAPRSFADVVSSLSFDDGTATYRQRLASNDARFAATVTFTPASWDPLAADLPVVEPYAARRAAEIAPG